MLKVSGLLLEMRGDLFVRVCGMGEKCASLLRRLRVRRLLRQRLRPLFQRGGQLFLLRRVKHHARHLLLKLDKLIHRVLHVSLLDIQQNRPFELPLRKVFLAVFEIGARQFALRRWIVRLIRDRNFQLINRARKIARLQLFEAIAEMLIHDGGFLLDGRGNDLRFEAADLQEQRHRRAEDESADMRPERDAAPFAAAFRHDAPELLQQPEREHHKRGRVEPASFYAVKENDIDEIDFRGIHANHERAHDGGDCARRPNQRHAAAVRHQAVREGRDHAAEQVKNRVNDAPP